MLNQLLGSNLQPIITRVASAIGLPEAQAKSFVDKALSMVEGLLKSDKADIASLLSAGGAGASSIVSKLDLSGLTGLVGGDTAKAKQGATTVVDGLLAQVTKDPTIAARLLEQFGGKNGSLGSLGQMAGKLFGR